MRNLALLAMAILGIKLGVASDLIGKSSKIPTSSIASFLQNDGTLKSSELPFGSLDVSGYKVYLDKNKCLIAHPTGISKIAADFTPLGGGLSDDCYKIIIDGNGNLIAAGGFLQAGGNPANNIAMWDGTNWTTLGAGVNGTILDMVQDNAGNIYVGGFFTEAGGNPANRVAMWDGTAWSALGVGLDEAATDIMLDNAGNLYVAGRFNNAGGIVANHIAIWDGTTWSTLGTGFNNDTEALAEDNLGNIYIGGSFTMADGIAVNRLAVWNGTNFAGVGGGFNNRVYELFIDPAGIMYASGTFTMAGGLAANSIASWDGTAWAPLGTGLNGLTWAMDIDANGDLFVGGSFTMAGGKAAGNIAVWDGTDWSEPGGGFTNSVAAITVAPNGNIYIGGDFVKFVTAGLVRKITVYCNTVLPIELDFFEADFVENITTLSWAKAANGGNTNFEIEHSQDQDFWKKLDYIQEKESSSATNSYEYEHRNPPQGRNYYRLKQIDASGGFSYSQVLSIEAGLAVEVYPNPVSSKLILRHVEIDKAELNILDSRGRWIHTQTLQRNEVDVSFLSPGIYFLSLKSGNNTYKLKIIKE